MTTSNEPRALIRYAVACTAAAVVLFWALYLVRGVLLIVYVCVLFAIGLTPIVRMIERQQLLPSLKMRVPRWLAILVIYLGVIGVLTLAGVLIVPPLAAQSRELWSTLPEKLSDAQQFLIRRGLIDHEITVREAVQRSPVGGDAVGTVVDAVTSVIGGIFGVVTVLILTLYLLLEGDRVREMAVRLLPRDRRERGRTLVRVITDRVSAWLSGQLLLGAIIGTTAGIGLWLMGVPYFYVLAFIMAIGELIPIVGPILSAIPAILVALTVSPALALGVVAFAFAQQQVENHLLVPKIMSKQVGVSAATVIIALLIGGELLGLLGAILAVPTAAIVQVLFDELVFGERPESTS